MLDNITPEDFSLPKVKNLQRIANRVREELRPEEPKDLDLVIDTDFLLTQDVRVDSERHIIVATQKNCKYSSKLNDGFATELLRLLQTHLHSCGLSTRFVGKGDSLKQIPLVLLDVKKKDKRLQCCTCSSEAERNTAD